MTNDRSEDCPLHERAIRLRKTYYPRLASFARRMGCTATEARDIAEDTLADYLMRPTDGEPVRDETSYLLGIVMRKSSPILKARWRRPQVPLDEKHTVALRQATWPTPEQHIEDSETLRAVHELPIKHRLPLLLVLEGLSNKEIGAALDISEAAAAQRVSRARKVLGSKIGYPRGKDTSKKTSRNATTERRGR